MASTTYYITSIPKYQIMKLLLTLVIILSTLFTTIAQNNKYVVEIAAFAEPVELNYFKDITGVYEALDVNYIYRYYKNANSQEEANKIQSDVKAAGFVHARVIDFDQLRQECSVTCDYVPPTPTGKKRTKAPSAAPVVTTSVGVVDLYPIFFNFDRYYLTKEAKSELDKYIQYLEQYPAYKLELKAHTDAKGNVEYNQRLSANRAKEAIKYLTARGINKNRLSYKTYGEGEPVAKNESAAGGDLELGRKLNRRIEFDVLDKSGNILNIVNEIKVPDYLRE